MSNETTADEPAIPGTVVRARTPSFMGNEPMLEVVGIRADIPGEHRWHFVSLTTENTGTRRWGDLIDPVVVYVPNIPSTND